MTRYDYSNRITIQLPEGDSDYTVFICVTVKDPDSG
jgi:hypothetical protein